MPLAYHAGVDLGAGSGRVLVGAVSGGITLSEVHRFAYAPRRVANHLRWDIDRLFEGLRVGLGRAATAAAAAGGQLATAGVDSWAIDYGLIDTAGELVEEPICYRDERTRGTMERAFDIVSREAIFDATGIQFLPFNTIFQLLAHADEGLPARASRLLMIPDLCHHMLCGSTNGEHTNASTTQLLRIESAEWDERLFASLRLPRELMPELAPPGQWLGNVRPALRRLLELPDVTIVQPATHDTASAVAGTPLQAGWAYISSGTWSLVGVERRSPLLGAAVLAANFTNERGVDGTFRFLKNVAGLWLLESCRKEWHAAGIDLEIQRLLTGAAALAGHAGFVFPDAPRFFNPDSMVRELRANLTETDQVAPEDPIVLTRVILDSLALRYASVVDTIETLTAEPVKGIHVVGGGSQNDYLNQATANATGRPVVAGPVEATSLGNVVMQAIASNEMTIADVRAAIGKTFAPRRFEPTDSERWAEAKERYGAIERETKN